MLSIFFVEVGIKLLLVSVAIHWKHDYNTHDVDVDAVADVGDGDAAAGAVLTSAVVIISRL